MADAGKDGDGKPKDPKGKILMSDSKKKINQTSSYEMTIPSKTPSSSKDAQKEDDKTVQPQQPQYPSIELVGILKEMNSNFTKLSKRVDYLSSLSRKAVELYESYEDYKELYDESSYLLDASYMVGNSTDTSMAGLSGADIVIEPDCPNYEPPSKKHCYDSVFKDLCDKFAVTEKCDNEVNDNLAAFVNSSFSNGIPSEEVLNNMVKDIHRPINCEALVKTKVNAGIWRLLKPQTQTEDVKFQAMQNMLVKAAANMVKLVDKNAETFDSQSVEWGSNAIALMGHTFKLIKNKRKESHRADLDPRYIPLTSSTLPYTEDLSVKDIQDLSKLAKYIRRGYAPQFHGGYYRRRSGRSAMMRGGRGRGFQRHQSDYSANQQQSKRKRIGHRK